MAWVALILMANRGEGCRSRPECGGHCQWRIFSVAVPLLSSKFKVRKWTGYSDSHATTSSVREWDFVHPWSTIPGVNQLSRSCNTYLNWVFRRANALRSLQPNLRFLICERWESKWNTRYARRTLFSTYSHLSRQKMTKSLDFKRTNKLGINECMLEIGPREFGA